VYSNDDEDDDDDGDGCDFSPMSELRAAPEARPSYDVDDPTDPAAGDPAALPRETTIEELLAKEVESRKAFWGVKGNHALGDINALVEREMEKLGHIVPSAPLRPALVYFWRDDSRPLMFYVVEARFSSKNHTIFKMTLLL
jgi:hypothetical protein